MALVQGKTGKPAPLPAATEAQPEPMDTSDGAAVPAAEAAAAVAEAGEPLDAAHAGVIRLLEGCVEWVAVVPDHCQSAVS